MRANLKLLVVNARQTSFRIQARRVSSVQIKHGVEELLLLQDPEFLHGTGSDDDD